MTILHVVIIAQTVALLVLAVTVYLLYTAFTRDQKSLLDRLMCRNAAEYTTMQVSVGSRRPGNKSMTDELEAKIEAQRAGKEIPTPHG